MGPLGIPELIVIFIVALVVFGPKKLPELGKSLGRGLREFNKAKNELKATWDEQLREAENRISETPRKPSTSRFAKPLRRSIPPIPSTNQAAKRTTNRRRRTAPDTDSTRDHPANLHRRHHPTEAED